MKQISYSTEARNLVKEGVVKLAKAVKTTLGPSGRNVVIADRNFAFVTKDGVTVAKNMHLEDPTENLGANMVVETALKTNDEAGDGTTTSVLLAEAILLQGLKAHRDDVSVTNLKKGIDLAVSAFTDFVKDNSIPVEQGSEKIKEVAKVSANGDEELANLIYEGINNVGKDGVLRAEKSISGESKLEMVEGMEFDRGMVVPAFTNRIDKTECSFENPLILLCADEIAENREIIPAIEVATAEKRPLLIIAKEINGEALQTLVVNVSKGKIKVCAVRAPGYAAEVDEYLEDIAAVVGANVFSERTSLALDDEAIVQSSLGGCDKIIVTTGKTQIVGGHGDIDNVEKRKSIIRDKYDNISLSDSQKKIIEERIAKLSSGFGIVYVGGKTEQEATERFYRAEDAVNAVKSAMEKGVVPGGGVIYLKAYPEVRKLLDNQDNGDVRLGIEIILDALKKPTFTIVQNTGDGGQYVVDKIMNDGNDFAYGYDARNGVFCDMIKSGIIDPAKVSLSAIESASSISGLLLTTETIVVEDGKDISSK